MKGYILTLAAAGSLLFGIATVPATAEAASCAGGAPAITEALVYPGPGEAGFSDAVVTVATSAPGGGHVH